MIYYRTSIDDIIRPNNQRRYDEKKTLEALEVLIGKVENLYSRPVMKVDDIKDFIIQYVTPPVTPPEVDVPDRKWSPTLQGRLSMDSPLSDWIPTLVMSISIIGIISLLIIVIIILLTKDRRKD